MASRAKKRRKLTDEEQRAFADIGYEYVKDVIAKYRLDVRLYDVMYAPGNLKILLDKICWEEFAIRCDISGLAVDGPYDIAYVLNRSGYSSDFLGKVFMFKILHECDPALVDILWKVSRTKLLKLVQNYSITKKEAC